MTSKNDPRSASGSGLQLCIVLASVCSLIGCDDGARSAPIHGADQQLAASGRESTHERLRQVLSSSKPGELSAEISALAMSTGIPGVCQTLMALWDGVQPPPVDVSVSNFSVPMVRLSLAATLHGCKGGKDDARYYDYVISVLDQSPDEHDRMRAAIRLGTVGTDGDVERLLSLARGTSLTIAVGAVGGLSGMDSSAAQEALRNIAADESLPRDVRGSAQSSLAASAARRE